MQERGSEARAASAPREGFSRNEERGREREQPEQRAQLNTRVGAALQPSFENANVLMASDQHHLCSSTRHERQGGARSPVVLSFSPVTTEEEHLRLEVGNSQPAQHPQVRMEDDLEMLLSPGVHRKSTFYKPSGWPSPKKPSPKEKKTSTEPYTHDWEEAAFAPLCFVFAALAVVALVLSLLFFIDRSAHDDLWPGSNDGQLRLNELQVLGSSKSYHVAPPPEELAWLMANLHGTQASEFNFSRPSITEQLEYGYRLLEFDVFDDPVGGRFAQPALPALLGKQPDPPSTEMLTPGFKVMGMQDADFRSSCPSLRSCLQEVERFSSAHARHVPIFIHLRLHSGPSFLLPRVAADLLPVTPQTLIRLEAEIQSTFPQVKLITPDSVRGEHSSLAEAITESARRGSVSWPPVEEAAGKVLFLLSSADAVEKYKQLSPILKGRLMFTAHQATSLDTLAFGPDQAIVIMESLEDSPHELTRSGHMVLFPLLSLRTELESFMWHHAVQSGCQLMRVHEMGTTEAGKTPPPPQTPILGSAPAATPSASMPLFRPLGTGPQARCDAVLDPYSCNTPLWRSFNEPIP